MRHDDLDPSRGVVYACLMSLAFWQLEQAQVGAF